MQSATEICRNYYMTSRSRVIEADLMNSYKVQNTINVKIMARTSPPSSQMIIWK